MLKTFSLLSFIETRISAATKGNEDPSEKKRKKKFTVCKVSVPLFEIAYGKRMGLDAQTQFEISCRCCLLRLSKRKEKKKDCQTVWRKDE